jgi:hypothetical protein
MKKQVKRLLTSAVAVLVAVFFMTACSDDDAAKNARLEVRLTDAPGDYQEVNIDIQDVQVQTSEGSDWQSVIDPERKGVYNLLELTNGLDTLLGSIELPAGRVSQIRLILGSENTITVDGETHDLSTPSAQQSGLKLNLQANLVEGMTYTVLLDFDVARSIVETGNGSYKLKPVIRAISEATSSGIKGEVSIPESTPAVYVINGTDTVGTSFANAEGQFMIKGLAPGTYKVSFAPATGYTIADIDGVVVTLVDVTDLGTVTVNQ